VRPPKAPLKATNLIHLPVTHCNLKLTIVIVRVVLVVLPSLIYVVDYQVMLSVASIAIGFFGAVAPVYEQVFYSDAIAKLADFLR